MFDLPIVVVKGGNSILDFFDHELIKFTNNSVCYSAVNALQVLEDAPANVVIAEFNVDDMNGIELAEAIRDIDEERGHYTYIIMIGTMNRDHVESEAFQANIDMITGTKRPDVMTHLTLAGCRISKQINNLLHSEEALQKLCAELRCGQLLEPLTGLGIRSFAEQTLENFIKQIESRGGAVCIMMIAIKNYENIKESYDTTIAGELVLSVSDRIQNLVPPLDVVTYYSPGQFALILVQPDIENCTAECYRRIYEGVKLKSYSTSVGYLPVEIGMSICASDAESGAPNSNRMISTAVSGLDMSRDEIVVQNLSS
jgi:PleD family two-component response regulator